MFELDSQLAGDTFPVARFALCDVLLMDDATYPWLVLVPRREGVTEMHQLAEPDRELLMRESMFVSIRMQSHFQADKMNIAALGNMVPQLHIHHIARYRTDAAWPKPVWGVNPPKPYTQDERESTINGLRALLAAMTEGE